MLDFPATPAIGQQYTLGVKSWAWNGTAWDLLSISDSQVLRAETAAAAVQAAVASGPVLSVNNRTGLVQLGVADIPGIDSRGSSFIDKGNSGTAAQVCDYLVAEVQQITVTGAFTLSLANVPTTRAAVGQIDLVNGGSATITFGTVFNWLKSDNSGTFTTNFALSGYTLQAAGIDSIIWWRHVPTGQLRAKVLR